MSVSDDPQAPPADAEAATSDKPTAEAPPEKGRKPQVIIKVTDCLCGTHEPSYITVVKLPEPLGDEELLELGRRLCRTVPGIGDVRHEGNSILHFEQNVLLDTEQDGRVQAEGIARELGVDPADILEDTEEESSRRPSRDAVLAAIVATSIFGGSHRRYQRRRPLSLWDVLGG